jgi:peptidoglycan/xylan/chitin deacetylase (PgdA/CDA1 family)
VNRCRFVVAFLLALNPGVAAAASGSCQGTLYLTFDTGNMRHAETIAATLAKHAVKATFFIAQEKTFFGNHALDTAWTAFWRARVAEGHAFGSHTWRHGSFRADLEQGRVRYRLMDGKTEILDAASLCHEIKQPDERFAALTGRPLDALWRAPGGRTTPHTIKAAQACGYRHIGWAKAGFLGDELPSDQYPNARLLDRALANLKDGDIVMAHLGLWSRQEPFAPMFDPLIAGLKSRGFCFATLAETP